MRAIFLGVFAMLAASGCGRGSFPEVTSQERDELVTTARDAFAAFGSRTFEVTKFTPTAEIRRKQEDPFMVPLVLYGIEFEAEVTFTKAMHPKTVEFLREHVGDPAWGPADVERETSLANLFGTRARLPGASEKVKGVAMFVRGEKWHLRLFDANPAATIGVDERKPFAEGGK